MKDLIDDPYLHANTDPYDFPVWLESLGAIVVFLLPVLIAVAVAWIVYN